MKTLYIECNMGAAGDMLMASLYELISDKEGFVEEMNSIGLKGVTLKATHSIKCGISGTHMEVIVNGEEEESVDVKATDHHLHEHFNHDLDEKNHQHPHEHHQHSHGHNHIGMAEIEYIISHLAVSEKVKQDVLKVYNLIAQAESHVHGKPISQVHFHEVGMMDAIVDIVGVCLLIDKIAPEKIYASSIRVGSGLVQCAHGIIPIPAPATAHILRGIPISSGMIQGELCTPTGAALLKYFVNYFGEMPVTEISQIGYGMGTKDFEVANCVRVFMGVQLSNRDNVIELSCNLDDMTPEAVGFAQERLFAGGALDVYTTSIGMKKNRPSIMLSCLCREDQMDSILRLIFKHTTTLGIREYRCNRYTLARTEHTRETKYGKVRVKKSSGWGVEREKVDYEDIAKIARENEMNFSDVNHDIMK